MVLVLFRRIGEGFTQEPLVDTSTKDLVGFHDADRQDFLLYRSGEYFLMSVLLIDIHSSWIRHFGKK
jgi:hypothetical protein